MSSLVYGFKTLDASIQDGKIVVLLRGNDESTIRIYNRGTETIIPHDTWRERFIKLRFQAEDILASTYPETTFIPMTVEEIKEIPFLRRFPEEFTLLTRDMSSDFTKNIPNHNVI